MLRTPGTANLKTMDKDITIGEVTKTHGGASRGQGRKLKEPKFGKRIKTAITMRPNHFEFLQDKDRSGFIDQGLAITIPALGHNPGTDACLITYHAVSEAIERLERLRDYHQDTGLPVDFDTEQAAWNADEARLHKLLNEFWDRLRLEPTFYEPTL